MVESVQVVSVPVSDQERAKSFYVDTLGFELRADNPWGGGMRWVEVATEGSMTSLALVTWFESMPPGSLQGLVVATEDIRDTHEEFVTRVFPSASLRGNYAADSGGVPRPRRQRPGALGTSVVRTEAKRMPLIKIGGYLAAAL